eukprot:3236304-Amphidinium_carterae.2
MDVVPALRVERKLVPPEKISTPSCTAPRTSVPTFIPKSTRRDLIRNPIAMALAIPLYVAPGSDAV